MNVHALKSTESLKGKVSESEWKARCELAAAYRLMDHFGMTDLSHNQICVRLPEEPNCFLVKSLDAFFDEVTASTLEKYDLDGKPYQNAADSLRGGANFHAAILKARPDLNASLHAHSTAVVGVSAQEDGLLMCDQHALHFIGRIAYHDYHGLEADPAIHPLLVRDLADKTIVFMRNHGALVCGKSIGSAFVAHHQLDLACRSQLAAQAGGAGKVVIVSEKAQEHALSKWRANPNREWPNPKYWDGCLRLADRLFPDYRD